jgi:hypothetical protein
MHTTQFLNTLSIVFTLANDRTTNLQLDDTKTALVLTFTIATTMTGMKGYNIYYYEAIFTHFYKYI